MKNKIRVKVLSIVLVLCLSVGLVPAAFAANGPSEQKEEWDGEVYYYAYATFCKLNNDGSYSEERAQAFADNTAKNEMKGASYSRKTNTLTLTDLNAPDWVLETNMMGDDFKINVVGNCALASIVVWGWNYSCNLTIEGTGTLTLNKKKKTFTAINMIPEGANCKVTFGKSVNVEMYGKENEEGGKYVATAYVGANSKDPFVFSNGLTGKTKREPVTFENEKRVEGFIIRTGPDENQWLGQKLTKAGDQKGVYAAHVWTAVETGHKYYGIKRYVFNDTYNCWLEDRFFVKDAESPFIGVEVELDALEENGFSFVTEVQKEELRYLTYDDIPGDGESWYYSTDRIVRASDPDGVYAVAWTSYDDTEIAFRKFKYDPELSPQHEDLLFPDPDFQPIEITMAEFENSNEWSYAYAELPVDFRQDGVSAEYSNATLYKDAKGTEYAVYEHWYNDEKLQEIYTLTPIAGLTDAYAFTPVDGVKISDLTPVTETVVEDYVRYAIPGTYFSYVGGEAPAVIDPAKTFKDINKKAWYYDAVSYAVNNKLFEGSNGKFDPDGDMTRGMFVSVLARMAGVETNNKVKTKFSDVKKGQWYTGAVKWASENGIVTGSGGKFMPNDPITREQICTVIVTYAKYMKITLTPNTKAVTFKDAKKISKWARAAVNTCQRAGLVAGSNGNFNPQNKASRAAVAQILMSFDKNFG